MLATLIFMLAIPTEEDLGRSIRLWKYCVMEKARLYEPTGEAIAKVAEIAINSCDEFSVEFTKVVNELNLKIPNITQSTAINEAIKIRDKTKARLQQDAEILIADIRVGLE